jgi:ABC-type histidine transport system ATPase subunit
MILFSIINKKIPYKNEMSFFSQNTILQNQKYFFVKNFEIQKNFYHLIKRGKLEKKKHRQFFDILSGELIFYENQELQNFRVCNYFSNLKRINFENNIMESINLILQEDFFKEKFNLSDILNKVYEFIEVTSEQKTLAIENFSIGFIQRIIYSIPLFLNYDLFIFSQPSDNIDEKFKLKIYQKILDLKKDGKTAVIDFKDNYFDKVIDSVIDFYDFNNINTYQNIPNKNSLIKKNFFYLSNQNGNKNNLFQSSEKIKIIITDKEVEFHNKNCLFKIILFTENFVICKKEISTQVKNSKFCILEINFFFLTSRDYILRIEIANEKNRIINFFDEKKFSVKNDFREDLNNKDNNGAFLAPKIEYL